MTVLQIHEKERHSYIAPEIYGHFSEHLGRCIYEGLFVGEGSGIPNVNGMRSDVVQALRELQIPVLRWPGGCFADEYHWQDGIGPKENRKKMINTHWGGVVEDNSFGTHEYMELCRQLECKTYVNGNLGSGSVREMSEWVEYMTFSGVSPMAELRKANGHEKAWKVDYFGVGNENWGCGGNMHPQYYANEYRRYQTYVRNYDPANPIQKICCGANADDYEWTREVLAACFSRCGEDQHGFMDGLSVHYYTLMDGWNNKGSATEFDETAWYKVLNKSLYMDTLITEHGKIMDEFDPDKRVGMIVDEWGTWYNVETGTNPGFLYQQNTIRDALVAAITLNIFNKHSNRVKMACLAQTVNVLQAVILTEGEQMVLTPTYHVMHMFRHHQGGQLLKSCLTGVKTAGVCSAQVPQVVESVSVNDRGIITITVANLSAADSERLEVKLDETGYRVIEAKIITGENIQCHNTFENPTAVAERSFEDFEEENGLFFTLPAASVVELRLSK